MLLGYGSLLYFSSSGSLVLKREKDTVVIFTASSEPAKPLAILTSFTRNMLQVFHFFSII